MTDKAVKVIITVEVEGRKFNPRLSRRAVKAGNVKAGAVKAGTVKAGLSRQS